MLTTFLFISLLQLLAAQNVLKPYIVKGTLMGTCPPEHTRDLVRQNLSQSAINILADFAADHPCGSGQWARVAYLNMSDPQQQCPSPWRLYSANGVRACGRPSGGCHSQNYTTLHMYNKVCGRIFGYQIGSTDAFGEGGQLGDSINEDYVDGVSVTYGIIRKHIWTFASGITEPTSYPQYSCPCSLVGTGLQAALPPSYVGNNYFCESGNPSSSFQNTGTFVYTNDPLWDGQMCDHEGQCCSNTTSPPWFNVRLPYQTNEKIEVRICGHSGVDNEDTPIGLLDIYVQ